MTAHSANARRSYARAAIRKLAWIWNFSLTHCTHNPMTYAFKPNETNEQRNQRLAQEFKDYTDSTPNPTSYPNWLASMKHDEQVANGS